MLADFFGHLFWSEAHGSNVVGTQGQLALWSLHEFYSGTVAVSNVHHGKTGVGSQVALMVARAESVMEDLNCIVCRDKRAFGLVHSIYLKAVHNVYTHTHEVKLYLLSLHQEVC